jgi:SAM-dependent methyltransferase
LLLELCAFLKGRFIVGAYADDLAYIHDVGYGDFARNAAPWIVEMLRRSRIDSGLIVELGCGSGITSHELVSAGYRVLGTDQSSAMIKLARSHAPMAKFRRISWPNFEIPPCAVVIAIGEVLCYRMDPNADRANLSRLFQRVYNALQPGGIFIFDLATPGRGAGQRQHHRSGPDWAAVSDVEVDEKLARLTRRIIAFRKIGRHYRRSEEIHELQLYRPQEIVRELRNVGFRVNTVRAYGQQQFPPGMIGFIARRPE